ncbi:MAG: preprotein translocase subunit YajC [Planctomycetaceae bacterium]|nr:preprotein translocase subunit YajC [Planctomycetaceae bacterium]
MGNWSLNLNSLLIFADEAAKGKEPIGIFDMFGPPLMMMVMLYYFFVVMPQKKDRKGRDSFLDHLKKNDQIVTIGGIYGTISGFSADGTQVTIRVDENSRIRVRKSSIESVVKTEGTEKKSDETPSK